VLNPKGRDRPETTSPLTDGSRYTPDELEFMRAVERFQKANRKKFPTAVDYLRIAAALGYRKAEVTK
jgi:hypothetical protein